MKIKAIRCLICGDIIYSRARHNMRYCSCEAAAVNGGFDYIKVSAKNFSIVENLDIEVDATKEELYNDWVKKINKFGLVKARL